MTATLQPLPFHQSEMNDFHQWQPHLLIPSEMAQFELFRQHTVPCQRRRVMFSSRVHVAPQPSPLDTVRNKEDVDRLWYTAAQLDAFRNEARAQCRLMMSQAEKERKQQQQNEQNISSGQTQPVFAAAMTMAGPDPSTRGLEAKICRERQRRRYLSIKCIVRSQNALDSDRLAALAFRCTRSASELAAKEAIRDFVRAYDLEENEFHSMLATRSSFTVGNKRSMGDVVLVAEHGRRIRPRLA